jgi:hypothetical protein
MARIQHWWRLRSVCRRSRYLPRIVGPRHAPLVVHVAAVAVALVLAVPVVAIRDPRKED